MLIESGMKPCCTAGTALRNQKLPALDPGAIRYAAHSLGNYLNITSACIGLLGLALRDHPERDVHSWLEGLARTTDMMAHVVR